jgi:hypothetical protein
MRKIEITLLILVSLAILLNIFDIPGTLLLLTISICTTSMFYIVFGFCIFNQIRFRDIFKKEAYKNTNWKRILFAIAGGYTMALLLLGLLFRVSYWAGSGAILMFSILTAAIIMPIAIIKYIATKSSFCNRILLRLTLPCILAVFLYVMPASFIVNFKYRNNPEKLKEMKERFPN